MMIDCVNLSKRFEIGDVSIEAVRKVSFSIDAGEFLVILGHSGSGKSTLLSMIGGLARPSDGVVSIAGQDIWLWSDGARSEFRNRTLGFVFQFASLIPTLTVLDNVMLPALFGCGMSAEARNRAAGLLGAVGLADKLDCYPSEISGGQQRRVAISRAFVNEPRIIIADEPTGDLDEEAEADVMRLFTSMCRERKTAILMVTHNRDLTRFCDRTMEMKAGEIVSTQSKARGAETRVSVGGAA
ncbi:MAG: ABC transporter ATP-binding protein [Hyphomicrobiales bacterium]|nr:ABC transporter ATP-binding protein [Hyphomicrobiales bacterium]